MVKLNVRKSHDSWLSSMRLHPRLAIQAVMVGTMDGPLLPSWRIRVFLCKRHSNPEQLQLISWVWVWRFTPICFVSDSWRYCKKQPMTGDSLAEIPEGRSNHERSCWNKGQIHQICLQTNHVTGCLLTFFGLLIDKNKDMEEKNGGLRDGQGQQKVIIEHSIREWKLGNGKWSYWISIKGSRPRLHSLRGLIKIRNRK